MSDERRPVRRALISVYDKTGLAELAQGLHAAGVTIVSTGSTAATIAAATAHTRLGRSRSRREAAGGRRASVCVGDRGCVRRFAMEVNSSYGGRIS